MWSKNEAKAWARRTPWLTGANFTPSTAINQLEMWQAESFDPVTIDRELGWAAAFGMNVMRVYLHDVLWAHDREGFISRIRRYLEIADGHGIATLLTVFDDCWNDGAKLGKQPDPRPGVHNSGWLQSPGRGVVNDRSQWGRLETYVKELLGAFAQDRRVLGWDLYNEPGNSKQGGQSVPLLRETFRWAREAGPSQPLTSGVWNDDAEIVAAQLELSDIVTFHNYLGPENVKAQVAELTKHGRPLVCTEWMSRPASTVKSVLPIFFEAKVGAIVWGLVSGKTNTIWSWASTPGSPEPDVWFHDLLRKDGTPFDQGEVDLFRTLRQRSGGS
jgi:hypothetical protein